MAGAFSSAYSSAFDTSGAPAAAPSMLPLLGVGCWLVVILYGPELSTVIYG
jgi:hypothetical protein